MATRTWITAGVPEGTYHALAQTLPASRVWSLLLEVAAARARQRRTFDVAGQWERDRFVQPSAIDQRVLIDADRHLLAAASAFDAIELSPVAPLGVCSQMGRASQNKVLSALRGTEVVADPTNVMALECARRLRRDASTMVRLATSHRCVRTQELPKGQAFTASFRIFCLASAGMERQNHGLLVDAVGEQIEVMLGALDRLQQHGYQFPDRRVTILASEARAVLGDRVAAALAPTAVDRKLLDHPYYSGGLRFQIAVRGPGGADLPLADGGAFDWVAAISSNRRAVFVASGFGTELSARLFRQP